MIGPLDVFWGDDELPTGQLGRAEEGTQFRYDVRTPAGRRISHSLPVDDARAYDATFFENLLPDGIQRERLARRLGVSDTSTLALLEAVGGDCAGALSLLREGDAPAADGGALRELDEQLLTKIERVGAVVMAVDEGARLSLAGAQDKIAVVRHGDRLFVPSGATASTHILKLPNRDFRGLCSNEHFVLALASGVGLDCARAELLELFGRRTLLVERFDRRDGKRLHQEDVCQALGLPPSMKYEADGGPSLLDIVALLDEASTEPGDVLALVRWQAFNIAVGNNDGHHKNLSLLREPTVRLAPAYDLVCTRAWPEVSRSLALAVGGERDAARVGAAAWRAFAREASLSPRAVLREVEQVTSAVADHAAFVAERAMDEGADATAVRNALNHVQGQSKRALTLLAHG